MSWFRWWHGTVTDPKFKWVAKKVGCSTATVIAVWAVILEHSSSSYDKHVTDGNVTETFVTEGNVTVTDGNVSALQAVTSSIWDLQLDLEEGQTTKILAAFEEIYLIKEGHVANWEKRYEKRENSSTVRVRRHRQQKKKTFSSSHEASETLLKHSETLETLQTLQNVSDKKEESNNKYINNNNNINKYIKNKNKIILPVNFCVTEKHREYARQNNLPSPDEEFEKFKNHHVGKGTKWIDWDLAFYNWLRNAKDFKRASTKQTYLDPLEMDNSIVADAQYQKNIEGML